MRKKREIMCREHLISTFVGYDCLILAAYWLGVYTFSFEKKDYMYRLAKKMSMEDPGKSKTMKNFIWSIGVIGLVWIALSFSVRCMMAVTLRLFDKQTIIRWNNSTFSDAGKIVLVCFSLLGFATYDVVYFMAIMNYAVQTEVICNLLFSVRAQVTTRLKPNDKTVKDFQDIRQMIHLLNRRTAAPTAIVIFILMTNAIFALITLDEIHDINRQFGGYFNEGLAITTAFFNIMLWLGPVFYTITQAARVSHQGERLRDTGFQVHCRSFGYETVDRGELDSYLAFTRAAKLRATMFGIPVYPRMVYAVILLFTLAMLILCYTGTYALPLYL